MLQQLRNRYFLVLDVLLLPVAVYCSFALRLESFDLGVYAHTCLLLAGVTVIVLPAFFAIGGLYARYWPFASLDELILLSIATLISTGATALLTMFIALNLHIHRPPISIPFIFALLALVVTGTPRILARLYIYRRHWHHHDGGFAHVLIMGAGEAGALVVQELRRNPQLGLEAVGLVDDDTVKIGMRIHGVPVLGTRSDIPRLALKYGVQQVIIALPAAPGTVIREITRICEGAHVQVRIMPGLYELLGGKVSVNQLRNVEIQDLLRREPVQTDVSAVAALLQGKRVFVTGGGGSIGSELCRQVLACRPAQLIILGHGENSVFEIEAELNRRLALENIHDCTVNSVIADLRMPERLLTVFEQCRPQIVFHAAAHKHVPLMELNPTEAITNNVIGTRNLLEVCQRFGVQRFVAISTDKAVNPTSIMGASKRVMELLVLQAARATGKPYAAVRFGNVLGSRGSVVLTFRRQIASGGPVTITHPEMRRFFMTIPEAVQLVLQAAVLGHGGEIFTLDMGQPVRLVDLATDMIRLSGLELGRDIEITYTGVRPGEKLYEELFLKDEEYGRTAHEKIFIAQNASTRLPTDLDAQVEELHAAARHADTLAIHANFRRLIPEYQTPLPMPLTPSPSQPQPQPQSQPGHEPVPMPSATAPAPVAGGSN